MVFIAALPTSLPVAFPTALPVPSSSPSTTNIGFSVSIPTAVLSTNASRAGLTNLTLKGARGNNNSLLRSPLNPNSLSHCLRLFTL
ncbi:hypothetical protein LWI28_018500 [Acer negundo]|uniref:Uncharacterized protein n=1 Tax=Acer negundo TaxID=4023 RepID=A0AAD5JKD3_ACENE|nr:hypothetical protein LWI28_018500 [Acer negundo]